MLNPWVSFGMKAWQIGLEAQTVIALRMIPLATGGARAEAEASRMGHGENDGVKRSLRKCRDSRYAGRRRPRRRRQDAQGLQEARARE
jgi:hypothetical protein